MTMRIEVFEFQPFESRRGIDTVYGLRFHYDPALTEFLKAFNRAHKDEVLDEERNVLAAGGWNPKAKCWFIEKALLPALQHELERFDCMFAWGEGPRRD